MQHTNKDRQPYPRDLNMVLEESDVAGYNHGYLDNMLNTAYPGSKLYPIDTSLETRTPLLPLRRARAGTMPSVLYMNHPPQQQQPQHLAPVAFPVIAPSRIQTNRHRSGSLTLPAPAAAYAWRSSGNEPISPSTEQLLQQGDDIARTLRSLGLDDDKESGGSSLSSASTIVTPTGGSPSSNLLQQRTSLRSRSCSVNNVPMYQHNINGGFMSSPSMESLLMSHNNNNNNSNNNRPRASSMGKMDYSARVVPPGLSSLWKMQLDTVDDDSLYESIEETCIVPEPSLSLGDSELLANMLHTSDIHQNNIENTASVDFNNAPSVSVAVNRLPPLPSSSSVPPAANTSATRSLWIGNIDASVTVDILFSLFSKYGPIESVRLLLEKECAFINYFNVDDAVYAKEDVLSNLGGKIGDCVVRIGYGKVESVASTTVSVPAETSVVSQPTRALWIGNMSVGVNQTILQRTLSSFGVIESVRVLSHKNCAFVNFERIESAKAAKDAFAQNDPSVQELAGVRIGFAKVLNNTKSTNTYGKVLSRTSSEDAMEDQANKELWTIMQCLGAPETAISLVKSLNFSSYFESIPPVPEFGARRKYDMAKLRETRKKLDSLAARDAQKESDAIAMDCMEEIAEICSDHIGNTVVQRFFEKCSEDVKTVMLQSIAPHLAALGVHKNGTWAAQKIIDSLNTPKQIQIVCSKIQPFIPPLLLDQFGNYVVQGCLRLNGDTQFIVNAIVEKFLHIAQGRYGARAMRGILDSSLITKPQQMFIVAALLQNAVSLSIHANGGLLISWFIDNPSMTNCLHLLAAQLAPCIVQVATHKLGSQIMLKLINQDTDAQARDCLYQALNNSDTMLEVLSDQARGLNFALKAISSTYLTQDQKSRLQEIAHPILTQLKGTGYKKASLEFSSNTN